MLIKFSSESCLVVFIVRAQLYGLGPRARAWVRSTSSQSVAWRVPGKETFRSFDVVKINQKKRNVRIFFLGSTFLRLSSSRRDFEPKAESRVTRFE